jgi:hypothetical protein
MVMFPATSFVSQLDIDERKREAQLAGQNGCLVAEE